MTVGLEAELTGVLEQWREWQRLTDLFAPDLPGAGRLVQLEPVRHGSGPAEPEGPVGWAVPGVWPPPEPEPEPGRVVLSVGELVGEVQRLLGLIGQVDPSGLPVGRALGEAQALAQVAHAVRHVLLARTGDVHGRHLYEYLGYRSAAAWQRDTAPDAVAADRTLARRLGGSRHLAGALAQRRVSFAAAQLAAGCLVAVRAQLDRPDGLIDGQPAEPVISAVLEHVVGTICRERFGLEHDPGVDPAEAALLAELHARVQRVRDGGGSQRDRLEQAVVLLAEHLPVRRLRPVLQDLRFQLLPSTLEDQDRSAQDKRALQLRKNPDGTWDLHGVLTPEVGEQVFTALAAEARRDPANPLDTHARAQARARSDAPAEVPGWEVRALRERTDLTLDPDPELVPRTRSTRLHDAFARLLSRYLSHGLGGTRSKVPVQVAVTLSDRTVEGAPGAPPAHGGSGRPLARSLVRRWWCDAHVTALLMSRGYKPLGVVHSARTTTGTEMTALLTQYDNRCPGLDCCPGEPDPLIPLVPHHALLFSQTGQTSLGTTLPACPVLHDDIHLGKKVIRLRDGRYITEDGYLHPAP